MITGGMNVQIKNSAAKSAQRKSNLEMVTMALPGFLLLLVFNYLPMFGIVIAFKKYNPNLGIFKSPWCGFDNFKFFFTSQDAGRVLGNTLFYSITFIIVDLVAAVALALMFYNLRSRKALKVYNTVVILPKFMSAVLIAFIVNPSFGLLNRVLVAFGGERIQWYMKSKYWPLILTITHIWQTIGMNSIIYYASLMNLDEGLIEAAKLDGANKWQQTWHVVIPHLVPVMVTITILAIGRLFTGDFGLFYQTSMDVGALYPTTDIVNTYVFRALKEGALEKSSAVNLFQSAMGLMLVVITNKIVQKVDPDSSLW